MTTEEKLNKAAYLLGISHSMTLRFLEHLRDYGFNVSHTHARSCEIIEKGIDELFYENEIKDE